ncbi:MAG: SpoIIE family protein phosphatase [Planctomycetes bacterium]|nr:SpoIIE family protein phosphatase [Planctomycetota bacterium]
MPAPHTGRNVGTILIVDTDGSARGACRAILEESDYEVRDAMTLTDALAVLEHDAPDTILLDADSAGATTWRVAAQRLKLATHGAEPRIVLVLDAKATNTVPSVADAWIDEWLVKPVRAHDLLLRVSGAAGMQDRLTLRNLRGDQTRMWNVLLDFSRSMSRVLDLDTILDQIVRTAAEMSGSRRVSIMLPDDTGRFLTIAKSLGIDTEMRQRVRVPVGKGIAGEVFSSGVRRTVLTTGPIPDQPYESEAFVSMPIIASLNTAHDCVGVLNITHRFGDRPFEDWELEFIDLLGSIAGSVIDDSLWRQTRESLLKMERDLLVARRIQQSTFPFALPELDGFQVDAWSQPADETAGDTYDIIPLTAPGSEKPDRVVLLLADATGHGIGPALSVTQVRAMLRMGVRQDDDLLRIARHMNEQLHADLPGGRFITAWLGALDVPGRTLSCVSAGQGPILRYDAERDLVERLDADTIPLGIMPTLDLESGVRFPMNPGDIVAVLSDGIFETTSATGELFGTDRVVEIILATRAESPGRIVEALRDGITRFAPGLRAADDRTAIVVKAV